MIGRRTFGIIAMAVVICASVSGCTASAPAPSTSADAEADAAAVDMRPLGTGFVGATPPTPEATIDPEPGSWDGVVPPAGYRVVLIAESNDAAATTLSAAVKEWATREKVGLTLLTAAGDTEVLDRIDEAVAVTPDLVIGVGDGLIDMFTLLTPQRLEQQFLILGAELPEPTANVTSVIWSGATYRGTGLSASGGVDAATVTVERADEAITAGVASVLHDLTGIVLKLG
ncbi:BMP family ABC transporter substrate-binding protein [Leifsonia sp. A12D58]|uniref:BMP family ABC transporter substrate-binding protein n=1 Tax=Leifsonia sp. A12D58 TaxID=3397674 RepID=UPI0039E063D4